MRELELLNEWDEGQDARRAAGAYYRPNGTLHIRREGRAKALLARWRALGGDTQATRLLAVELGIKTNSMNAKLRQARKIT